MFVIKLSSAYRAKGFTLVVSLLLCLCTANIFALDKPKVAVLYTSRQGRLQQVINDTLLTKLKGRIDVLSVNLNQNDCPSYLTESTKKAQLLITLGPNAFKQSLQCSSSTPIIAMGIYKRHFQHLITKYPNSRHPTTAIYLGQSIQKQLDLIQVLSLYFNHELRIGAMIDHNFSHQDQLMHIAKSRNLTLTLYPLYNNRHETKIETLNRIIKHNNFLLLLPSDEIISPQIARGVLLTSLRHGVPVIGYTKKMVRLGALASISSSKINMANELVQIITQNLENNFSHLPPPNFAREYNVTINQAISETLGTEIHNNKDLVLMMHSLTRADVTEDIL